MARELGLNPKKFGGLTNTKQEPWKLPLPEYIEELYIKHFKKSRPDSVRSIEQMVRDYRKKKQKRKILRIEKIQIHPGREKIGSSNGTAFYLHGVPSSRFIFFSGPTPPIPGQMDYIV